METKTNSHPTLEWQDIIPVLSMTISAILPILHALLVYEKFEKPDNQYPQFMQTTLTIQHIGMGILVVVMSFKDSLKKLYHAFRVLVLAILAVLASIFFGRIEINPFSVIWGWLFLIFFFLQIYKIIYKPAPTIDDAIRDAQTGH